MLPYLFAHPLILTIGFFVGILLGFLLQKAGVSQFKTIVGQLLLRDFTLAKVLITALIVGSTSIHLFLAIGLPINSPVIPWSAFATIVGAAIMGIGIAILGYCPGTCAAAAGQGSNDAWWGLLGMLIGGAFYAETHFLLKRSFLKIWTITTETMPNLLNISPWIFIVLLSLSAIIFFTSLDRKAHHAKK
ncbi:YeeE/YedE family protein [Candidatus Dependentiae bacterium]|nr:YeeE/YedE family protein [Candidatus Dependentiae bacterium]